MQTPPGQGAVARAARTSNRLLASMAGLLTFLAGLRWNSPPKKLVAIAGRIRQQASVPGPEGNPTGAAVRDDDGERSSP